MERQIHIGTMRLSWDEIQNMSETLADIVSRKFRPDAVVAVGRAGLVPGLIVANSLNIELFPVAVRYPGDHDGEPEMLTPPLKLTHIAEALIVDDIAISGKTLTVVAKTLADIGVISRTATLFRHPRFFEPDFWVRETIARLIFPWDVEK